MEIQDKVILITGASSGIGEETAMKFASNGARVVLCARSEGKLEDLKEKIQNDGGSAMVAKMDVTNKNDWEKTVQKAKETYGSLHVIVNNAGLMPLSYVDKLKTDEWEQMVDVNLKGVLNGVAAVLPTFIENEDGHIVNISSSAAHNYFPGGAVYCATKSAVKMFSEGLRQELAPKYGINVSSIEPGAVDTNLFETITDSDIKEKMSLMEDMTTLQPEDIAEAIYYTVSSADRVNVNDVYVMPTEQIQ